MKSLPGFDVKTLESPKGDGRNVDASRGILVGEGAQQRSVHQEVPAHPLPRTAPQGGTSPTYYEQPMLKQPVWRWMVPAYFYTGGMAGGAALLGGAIGLFGGGRFARLEQRCYQVGFVNASVSGVLLIADLGRPTRFLNMMRVFRPTSPMNLGVWLLSGAVVSLGFGVTVSRSRLWPLAMLGRAGCFVFGAPLASYTGVLLANTAVPLWQSARKSLPLLFMGSALASSSAALEMLPLEEDERKLVGLFALVGRAAELAMGVALEREVRAEGARVEQPLRTGASGALWKASKVLTGASLALTLVSRKSKRWDQVAAVAATLGALALRFGIYHAGSRTTRDARASFEPQRERAEGIRLPVVP